MRSANPQGSRVAARIAPESASRPLRAVSPRDVTPRPFARWPRGLKGVFALTSDFEETKVSLEWLYLRWAMLVVLVVITAVSDSISPLEGALVCGVFAAITVAHTVDARLHGHIPVFYAAKGVIDLTMLALVLWAIGDPQSPLWALAVLVILYESIGHRVAYVWLITLYAAALQVGLTVDASTRGEADWADLGIALSTLALAGAFASIRTRMDLRLRVILKSYGKVDQLTGLLSRRGFEEEAVANLLAARYPRGAVVVADLNGLKEANDRYGHRAGDEVLTRYSTRLREVLGTEAVVGRLGGDEFVAYIPEARTVAEELLAHLRLPDEETGCDASVGARAVTLPEGFAGWPPERRQEAALASLAATIWEADYAMYADKAAARARKVGTVL